MINKFLFVVFLFLISHFSFGQSSISLNAVLDDSLKIIHIQQELRYVNNSSDTLNEIFLNDWTNAFKNKSTPLAKRFSEEYERRFHFAEDHERGSTEIDSVVDDNSEALFWVRPDAAPDIVKVILSEPLHPGDSTTMQLDYSVKIPNRQFTRFGYAGNGDYKLRYWFITPAVYENEWIFYSNKNLDDQYVPFLNMNINITFPNYLSAISALNVEEIINENGFRSIHFSGEKRADTQLFLTRNFIFEDLGTEELEVISNLKDEGLNSIVKSAITKRVLDFLEERLGEYPHDKMLLTEEDYSENPVYGLSQLPKFIRPFPEGFHYDLKQLKAISSNYLGNILLLNPRTEKWIIDAIQIYLLMEYVQENYPGMTIIGNLSDFFGIEWFHASELAFNDQYALLYMLMARQNLDQALSAPQDSLIKFNRNLANPYKAGVGLKYLEHFLQDDAVSEAIKEFYTTYKLKEVDARDFEEILKKNSEKKIDWFFKDYVDTDNKIDFKIKKVIKTGDSLEVTIKNKTEGAMPVPLYGLNDDNVVFRTWVENVQSQKTIKIPAAHIERLAVNYEGILPEINQRDNYEAVTTLLDKPVQFRLFKDVENPHYTQLFFMPAFEFNLYDGLAIGPTIYNQAVLERNFNFEIAPMYGSKSETIVGGASFSHRIPFEDQPLFSILYGASGSRFSYGYGMFYERFTPYLQMVFRDPDFRKNKYSYLTVRNVNVYRDEGLLQPSDVEDYSIFDINYTYNNTGMVKYLKTNIDFQLAQQFSKASATFEYRKLFKNNRQINLRLFAGTFIYNDFSESDYFSFALDRPTDYLYDYNYYGRSETSGIFSQQIIMAEGGFKSQLEPEFANQWLTTLNTSTNLWKWIYVYGDAGVMKNKYRDARFVYDSGVRLSFIADYFEVFFPVYSNLGWEMTQENYDQRIRFIATLDLKTISRLFSREWY